MLEMGRLLICPPPGGSAPNKSLILTPDVRHPTRWWLRLKGSLEDEKGLEGKTSHYGSMEGRDGMGRQVEIRH